ncbi:hypothetical protein EV174_006371, partial [Coemansia sp. RSA 2320]
MHECIKRLISNVETPEEEVTESLAKLLTVVGKKLDSAPGAKSYMDVYFARIGIMSVNKHLTSRIRFMLKDVMELRNNGWVARMVEAGPKTIAEIHEDIERTKTEAAMRRAPSHAGRRTESHSGRGDGPGSRRSGWNTVGGPSGSGRGDQSQHVGSLAGFGNMSRSKQQLTGGPRVGGDPFSAVSGGSRGWSGGSSDSRNKFRDERPRSLVLGPGGGRTPSQSLRSDSSSVATPEPGSARNNMFEMLANDDEDDSHASSAKAPVDKAPATMDSSTMQRKISTMLKEYMSNNEEAEFFACFKELGEVNYHNAFVEIVNSSMERRPDHV